MLGIAYSVLENGKKRFRFRLLNLFGGQQSDWPLHEKYLVTQYNIFDYFNPDRVVYEIEDGKNRLIYGTSLRDGNHRSLFYGENVEFADGWLLVQEGSSAFALYDADNQKYGKTVLLKEAHSGFSWGNNLRYIKASSVRFDSARGEHVVVLPWSPVVYYLDFDTGKSVLDYSYTRAELKGIEPVAVSADGQLELYYLRQGGAGEADWCDKVIWNKQTDQIDFFGIGGIVEIDFFGRGYDVISIPTKFYGGNTITVKDALTKETKNKMTIPDFTSYQWFGADQERGIYLFAFMDRWVSPDDSGTSINIWALDDKGNPARKLPEGLYDKRSSLGNITYVIKDGTLEIAYMEKQVTIPYL